MAIKIYILEIDLNNKYFYVEILKKLLNIFNKKRSIRIPNFYN